MALLEIRCNEKDVTLAPELAADLPVEDLLDGFYGQEHVGPLGEAPARNV